jgi:hypothetical protein
MKASQINEGTQQKRTSHYYRGNQEKRTSLQKKGTHLVKASLQKKGNHQEKRAMKYEAPKNYERQLLPETDEEVKTRIKAWQSSDEYKSLAANWQSEMQKGREKYVIQKKEKNYIHESQQLECTKLG